MNWKRWRGVFRYKASQNLQAFIEWRRLSGAWAYGLSYLAWLSATWMVGGWALVGRGLETWVMSTILFLAIYEVGLDYWFRVLLFGHRELEIRAAGARDPREP